MPKSPTLSGTASERAATLVERCGGGREHAGEWQVRCPAHDDAHPSLSIGVKDDKVVLHCHAGCATDAVLTTLGVTMGELWVPQPRLQRRIVATYDYHDADGGLLYQVVRLSPKTFRQRRPDPDQPGAYLWDLGGIAPVLYHLPEVMRARDDQVPIYIVEGEKDADALRAQGVVATCNPMGAGKWRSDYTATLVGADVIVLPDYDVAGRRHATVIAQSLVDVAQSVKLVEHFHTETKGSDITDWLTAGGTREEFEALVTQAPLFDATRGEAAPVGWSQAGTLTDVPAGAWRKDLFTKAKGKELTQNYFNIVQILKYHDYWQHPSRVLWFDVAKQRYMSGTDVLRKSLMVHLSEWFGREEKLPLSNLDLLRDCLYAQCEENKRDSLQHWVNNLPAWDKTPRLDTWLHRSAGSLNDVYTTDVSRVLPVGMIARALQPGCPNRYVVIFQGEENTGKSALVRALASPEWYYAMKSDFESKEAHMEIQGAWVAELPELDALNRTGETRLKAFITLLDDSWIPKYANDRITVPRRTVFVGTTNEDVYLKGQTGNTRFVPLNTPVIDLVYFERIRLQLFAEAKRYYEQHVDDWWVFSAEGQRRLEEEREVRRKTSPYEDLLQTWLLTPLAETYPPRPRLMTTWEEIATDCLKMATPEHWKDKSIQMDVANGMKALGWRHTKRRVNRGDPPKWVWDAPENWGVPF